MIFVGENNISMYTSMEFHWLLISLGKRITFLGTGNEERETFFCSFLSEWIHKHIVWPRILHLLRYIYTTNSWYANQSLARRILFKKLNCNRGKEKTDRYCEEMREWRGEDEEGSKGCIRKIIYGASKI